MILFHRLAILMIISNLTIVLSANEKVIGLPCQGCEFVFVNIPPSIPSEADISPKGTSGEPMTISGQVVSLAGKPVPNTIIYAYQTNAEGIYPKGETWHGKLRAWVRTDSKGNYKLRSVRPGAYPGGSIPAHVHFHVIEPGSYTYYIDDLEFEGDPLIDEKHIKKKIGRGGNGISPIRKDEKGIWQVRRDIILGKNIPGYPK